MRTIIFKFILCIISATLIYSCHKESEHLPLLQKLDSIMQTNPDSAYRLLCATNITELQNEEKALYALLLTQAKDKRNLPQTNDSLISIAVGFYNNTNNSNLKSKANFYLGRVLQESNNIPKAINAYLEALNSPSSNHTIQVQIYDNLAECYESQNYINKALEMYNKSYSINIEYKDSTKIIFPLRGIANLYLIKGDTTKAIKYYRQALHILKGTNDSIWKSTIYCDMARLFHHQKNYGKAYKYIERALRNSSSSDELSAIFYWKGTILFDLDRYDSASHYLKQASLSYDIYTKAASFQALYELRKKQKSFDEAIAYNDKALSLYDSIQDSQHQEEINEILKAHTLANYRQEQKQRHIIQIAVLSICSLIGISVLVFIFMNISNREKKRYIELQQELMKIISDRNELKEELKILSSTSKNANKKNEELQSNLLRLWEQTMQICKRLFETTDSFKKISSIEKKKYMPDKAMKQEDVKSIRIEIKKTFAEAIQNFQELYPSLTQEDIFFCILSYLKLADYTVKTCMEVASSAALTQRKYRIKKQLNKQVFESIF